MFADLAVVIVDWRVRHDLIGRVGAVEDPAVPAPGSGRVLISYAHDDPAHEAQVLEFYEFLRANGVDALIDVEVAVRPQYWPDWMSAQIRQGGYVLVIGSPDYRAAAEDRLPAQERKGVRWEARLLKDAFYSNHAAARDRILPVLLPGRTTEDLPGLAVPRRSHLLLGDQLHRGGRGGSAAGAHHPTGIHPAGLWARDRTSRPLPGRSVRESSRCQPSAATRYPGQI